MDVTVQIKPSSKKGPLVEPTSLNELVYVRAPAVDRKTNAAFIKLLARHYVVAPTRVAIISGHSSRYKIVRVVTSN